MRYPKLKTFKSFILLIAAMLAFASCVGTIEDKNIDDSKTAEAKREQISFSGILRAVPIANDKVEVFFLPAPGNQDNLTYEIYLNERLTPITVQGNTLTTNPQGEYVYTVTGLETDTMYAFKVGVVDTEGNFAKDKFSKFATTFSNKTCDFTGISTVALPPGIDSQSKVKITWVPGTDIGVVPSDIRPTDPASYEISYVSDFSGVRQIFNSSAPDQVTITGINKDDRDYTVTGLSPGKTYFFNVRCVHDAYDANKEADPDYMKEQNSKILEIQTASGVEVFDFVTSSIKLTTPPGKAGETAIDVTWEPATGNFNGYKIYVHDAATDNPEDPLSVPDKLKDLPLNSNGQPPPDSIDAKVLTGEEYNNISADATSFRITGLRKYHTYQVKVVACRNSCANLDRIVPLTPKYHLVKPIIAPFQGITGIDHPRSSTTTDQIYLKFNSPSMTAGYAHRMDLYCISNKDDPVNNKHLMDTSATKRPTSAPETTCNGLNVEDPAPFPTTETALGTFQEVTIKGVDVITPTEYCFLMVPTLEFNSTSPPFNYLESDIPNSITKCVIPEIRPPNLDEFPGRDITPMCDVSGNTINMEWIPPTSGIYDNFIVFWKKKNGSPFNFDEAIAARGSSTLNEYLHEGAGGTCDLDTEYCWKANLSNSTTNYAIRDLAPGADYAFGVLTWIDLDDGPGVAYRYSENNFNTQSCAVELPKAKFKLWHNIFAIGPKQNGLMPPNAATFTTRQEFYYLPETLDTDGTPIEVEIQPDSNGNDSIFEEGPVDGDLDGTGKVFDGIFGYTLGDFATYPNPRMYSDTGIIHLEWEDITMEVNGVPQTFKWVMDKFYDDNGNLSDNNGYAELVAKAKKDRTFGYRIYRSDDNKATWKELTSADNDYQTTANEGLILPHEVVSEDAKYPRVRPNKLNTGTNLWKAQFTDYSVQHLEELNNVERPRVYWYRIVPVFDNKELVYDDTFADPEVDNPLHHLIKVVLPPPNMALVNRMMANKTICDEIERTVKTGMGQFYACDYKGLGSSSVQRPWNVDKTVYDLGGDLLVDRFELGCNFTRGRVDSSFSSSTYTGPLADFQGDSNTGGQPFRGCHNPNGSPTLTAGNYGPTDLPDNSDDEGKLYKEVIHGDCFGADRVALTYQYCANPPENGVSSIQNRIFPGAGGKIADNGGEPACVDKTNTEIGDPDAGGVGVKVKNDGYGFDAVTAQAEYGAVYYMRRRSDNSNWYNFPQPWLYSANDKELTMTNSVNRCFINLPVADTTNSGKWKPRWIATNQLFKEDNGSTYLKFIDYETSTGSENIDFELVSATINDVLNSDQFHDATKASNPTATYIGLDRFDKDTTPIAKIFSSNASKLPPLDGFSQKDLHKICGTYKVQQTASSPSGSLVGIDAIKPKRSWRRKEQVVASAWPNYYSDTLIADIEAGTFNDGVARGCNSLGRQLNLTNNRRNGDDYDSVFPEDLPQNSNPILHTGSGSGLFTGNPSTEKCVSKFGIQDHIGNRGEWTGDRIFCNFGQDVMVFGPSGVPDLGSTHIPYRTNGCQTYDETTGNCNNTGDNRWWFDPLNYTVQVQEFPGSGQCSVVQPSGNRNGVPYLNGSSMNSVFAPTSVYPSGINESIVLDIAQSHFDIGSMDSLRNGDGYFLDFGDVNIAPRIARNNSLQLRTPSGTDERLSRFFNPVVGFPLDCSPGTCTDSPDNMLAANSQLYAKWGAGGYSDVVPPTIQDWPLGNSDIQNTGISAINVNQTTTFNSLTSPESNKTYQFISNPIATNNKLGAQGVNNEEFYAPYDFGSPGTNNKTSTQFQAAADNVNYVTYNWTIPRNTRLFFRVGGGSDTARAGRYFLHLMGDAVDWMRRREFRSGGRCVVMVNDE